MYDKSPEQTPFAMQKPSIYGRTGKGLVVLATITLMGVASIGLSACDGESTNEAVPPANDTMTETPPAVEAPPAADDTTVQ